MQSTKTPHLRLTHSVSRGQIEAWARDPQWQCVYAVDRCWWSLWDNAWMPYTLDGEPGGIPRDPRGSVLVQAPLDKFWQAAGDNPGHYGRHGLDALVAAFHGNVEVLNPAGLWFPTSLRSWDAYNDLLDGQGGEGTNIQSLTCRPIPGDR